MFSYFKKLFDGQATNGVSPADDVSNYRHLMVAIDTTGNANMKIQILGSIQEEVPDFSAAQSHDNQWEALQLKDLQSGSSLNGDDGLAPAGADDHRLFEVNTNGIKWVAAKISNRSAGAAHVVIRPFVEE